MECLKVRHAIFGEGIAIDKRHRGHEYLVCFPHSLQLWLKKSNLAFLETEILPEEQKHILSLNEPEPEEAETRITGEERSVIEAFRLGIVPARSIREWTVGRTREIETVQKWLQDESSGTMIIRGEYGSGKTHLIEYLYASGFDLDYAVSLVGIDPCDAQPGFPKRIYRHLIKNLRFPYQGHYYTFCELLTLIGKGSERNPFQGHSFLKGIMEKIKKEKDTPQMWEWIEGQETAFSEMGTLYDHTTAANIYCNILSALGMLAAKELGLKGILLMFDEAETSRTYRYSYEWTRAVNFFNALSMVANDEPELKEERVIKGDNYYYGERTGLIYSGYVRIPYVFQLPSFLKVAFAFTPDYRLSLSKEYNIYEIELESLPVQQTEYLYYRLMDIYEKIYQHQIPKGYRRRLFEMVKNNSFQSTRRFIKAMVESLDFSRFYSLKNLEDLLSNVSHGRVSQY
ncbi:MAG: BREX system ATP-binding domain-containing protein [bacterium]